MIYQPESGGLDTDLGLLGSLMALYSKEVGLCIRGPAQALIPYVLGRIACAEAQRPSLSVGEAVPDLSPATACDMTHGKRRAPGPELAALNTMPTRTVTIL